MHTGHGHAFARVSRGAGVRRPVRLGIVAAALPFAPDQLAFLCFDLPPCRQQVASRDQEITARLLIERFSSCPDSVAESRILQQKAITVPLCYRRIMADFPM